MFILFHMQLPSSPLNLRKYMESIETFFENASALETLFWVIAIGSSVVFIIQAILMFVGFDSDSDFSGGDTDFDADGMNLVSVKTVACFLIGFGWTGAIFYPHMESKVILSIIAAAVGVTFMFLIAFLLRQVLRLSVDGTFTTGQTVGKVGEVYLRIPGGSEAGKVSVSHCGSVHELLAFSEEEIETGAKVRIVRAVDGGSVFVCRA